MNSLEKFSIKVKNYKCFGEEEQGFEKIMPINLIIGKNNSGKSALLEILFYAIAGFTGEFDINKLGHKRKLGELILTYVLEEEDLELVFQKHLKGGFIQGIHFDYGKKWLGKRITWGIGPKKPPFFIKMEHPFTDLKEDIKNDIEKKIVLNKKSPFLGFRFKRLQAARDIRPEIDSDSLVLSENGIGATNIIQNYLNKFIYPTDLRVNPIFS
jgi:hypothetical protein